jgi:predicted DNA-binding protein with PD1-like motif
MLPEDVTRALGEQGVTCGWFRASGVLVDLELRVFDESVGRPARSRRIAGPVQALSIEGSIGFEGAEVSIGLRAVIGRESDRGMEVLAGEIVSARVVALEALVTAFEDLAIGRALDAQANVVLFGEAADAQSRPGDPPRAVSALGAPPSAWSDAVAASAEKEPSRQAASRGAVGGAIPPRPARPQRAPDEGLMPDAGDIVEHFAFGRSEVVKSDGDRLHLRIGKDGRIKEIALEMLKVTPLEADGPQRRFRLDRKM